MKVTVDFDMCASTGSCMQVCPEVFEVRSDGYLYVLQEEPRRGAARQGRGGRRPLPDRRDHRRGVTRPASVSARWDSTTASPRPGRCRARCCASGSTPIRRRSRRRSTASPDAIERFCTAIVDATADLVCAFKPQFAHFASQRAEPALERVCRYIRERYPDVVLVLDAKRGDIGSTAEHYARRRSAATAPTPSRSTRTSAPTRRRRSWPPAACSRCATRATRAATSSRTLDVGGDAAVRAGRRRWSPRAGRRSATPGSSSAPRTRPSWPRSASSSAICRSWCPASASRAATSRRRCGPARRAPGAG